MHKLPHAADLVYGEDPMAIGASDKIAGIAYAHGPQLVSWDNADVAPRLLSARDQPSIIGMNAQGEVLANQGDLHGRLGALLWRQDGPVDLGALTDTVGGVEKATPTRGMRAVRSLVPARSRRSITALATKRKCFIRSYGKRSHAGPGSPRVVLSVQTRFAVGAKQTGIDADGVIVGRALLTVSSARSSWKMA